MNGNKLDDFFEQKLGNHKLPPPSRSWDQIENNLKKNQSKGISLWIKIAASFILLLTAGWLIIPNEKTNQENTIAKVVEEVQPDLTTPIQSDSKSKETPVITPIEEEIIQSKATNKSVKRLLAQAITSENEVVSEISTSPEGVVHKDISPLKLALSTPNLMVSRPHHSQVLPMDVSMMHTYAIERNEEVNKSRKFRMLNGIISIAKGVNKSKLGLEDIRSAKNGFISDELKYGNKVTEDVEDEGDTNSDDLNK